MAMASPIASASAVTNAAVMACPFSLKRNNPKAGSSQQ
jgi:hypothetical protein